MQNSQGPFFGRTIAVVNDLSVDEQLYLYLKTAELKKLYLEGGDISSFQITDPDMAVYLIFLENSTRTKESFRNAALFHNVKMNNFDAVTSSLTKSESMIDTLKMLFGYSKRSLFILRTTTEGTCRALEESLGAYADKIGRDRPSFINGGDGKHEHPTQEFLDEFSFLEQKEWNNQSIHIALTGDLFHGRTAHSKADGLKVFTKVKVDLIAPKELAMPEYYVNKMKKNGYEVRIFLSIDEYLLQNDISDIWYFTRLQLERMGEEILEKSQSLRKSVTFRREFIDKLPEGTKFYHPLPRHREYPVLPTFLDNSELNGYDEQSINGFFTRVVEIAMVGGKIGHDFEGEFKKKEIIDADFIDEAKLLKNSKIQDRYKVGIKPVEDGTVIDHIGKGEKIEEIWNLIERIRKVLGLNYRSSHGVYHTNDSSIYKGIISLPDIHSFERSELKKLAAAAPGSTLNIIKSESVAKKYRLNQPPRIYNFDDISCKNNNCITHPDQHQNVNNYFVRNGNRFTCYYCEKSHSHKEIWDI